MTTVKRKGKINIQISLDPFLLFVLASLLIHGIGLLILVFSNRSLPAARQETESTPIEFVVVPPEESSAEPPPDTERRAVNNSVAKGKVEPELPTATDKIGSEEAVATSEASPAIPPEIKQAPPRVETNPPARPKVPTTAIAPSITTPPVESKPQPREKTPLLSESDSTSIPLPEKTPPKKIETLTPKPDLPPVATNSTPQPKPIEPSSIPETNVTPPPEQETPVGSGSASLLGGTYRRTLAEDSGSSFFSPQANAREQALNPSGLDARQDLDLGPYFAEIRRRVKRNWQPSAPNNNRHTVLAFSIQRNGQITGLQVIKSSGSPKIDRESLAAVQKSAPFAALPANFPKEQLNVEFNFNIYVNQGVFTPQLENWQRF